MTRYLLVLTIALLSLTAHSQTIQTVKGTIIDETTESPVEKVDLKIQSVDSKKVYTAETDDDGAFQFKNVDAGKYRLVVFDKDYRGKSFPVEFDESQNPVYTLDTFGISLNVTWMFNWGKTTETTDAKGDIIINHPTSHFVARIILIIYGFCLVLIFFYSVLQFSLSIAYARNRKKKEAEVPLPFIESEAPFVTVQLPMYNELYVAERIIETIAAFDYPRDRFQIQVLDDSTDETVDVIAKKVAEVAATGINIQHVHRVDRTGYKAGALDAAMDQVQGEFIAIFDADFVPEPDFLQRMMPYFADPNVGVVQSRWGHLNKNYSLITELQAFGLNGHFAVEHGGRTASGHFINFNGTGGIWRKTCIADAGGWEHDTLTEDLDLSYRAQMKGWRFVYREEIVAPAELPITMSALKNQQHRWMKGGAECFIKMWKRLLRAKEVTTSNKIHGLSHLFNSSVFMFILLLSLLSLPVLHIKDSFSDLNFFLQFGSIFIISTIFLGYYYWLAYRDKKGNTLTDFFRFLGRFLTFLTVSMGLSLSNTVAVLEGYMGIKSSFVRTPKFNVAKKGEAKNNKYDKKSISLITIGEGILMCTFGFTAVNRAIHGDLGMVVFHLMLTVGYATVFFSTLKELKRN